MASFGGSVKLTGESEYRKALSAINQSLREVDSELKLVTSQYDKNDKSEKALSDQTEALNKKYDTQNKKVSTIQNSYNKLSKEVEDSEKKHKELGKELSAETDLLKQIEKESGKDSQAYKEQAKKVSDLSTQYAKEEAEITKNKKALSDMYVEMNKAQASANKTGAEIQKLGKEAEEASKGEKNLGDKASDASSKMDKGAKGGVNAFAVALGNLASNVIAKCIKGLQDLGKEAINSFKAFDDGRDTIIKATGATGEEADKLIASYEKVSKSIVADMGTVGNVIGDVSTRFGFTGEKLEDASTAFLKFSEVTGVDAKTAVASVSRAMEKAGMSGDELTTFMDKLVTASQKTGVQVDRLTDSLTKYSAPMKQLGFTTDQTIALFSQFEASGVNVEQAFGGLQKAVANWAKEGKNSQEEFSKLMDSIKNSPSDIDATQKAIEAFGSKTGVELADAIRSGKMEYSELINTITSNQGALESTFEGTKDASDDVKLAFQNVKIEMGKMVEKILVKYSPQIQKAIEAIVPILENIIDNVFPVIEKSLDWIGNNIIPVVADGIKWIKDNIEVLLPILAGLGTAILIYKTWQAYTTMVTVAQKILNAVLNANPIMLVVSAIAVLISALGTLYATNEDFREAVNETWNKIKEGAEIVWEGLKILVTETIPNALYDLGEYIVTKGAEILEYIGTFPQALGEIIGSILYDASQFVINLANKAKEAGLKFLTNIWNEIKKVPGKFASMIGDTLTNIGSFIVNIGKKATEAGKKFFKNIWNEVKSLPKKFLNLGKDLVEGIWNGIKKAMSWLKDKIGGFCKKVTGWVKSAFSIFSPSHVFRDEIGKQLALGIGVGFEDEMEEVSNMMADAIPSTFDITPEVTGGITASNGIFGSDMSLETLTEALKQALTGVDVMLDDRKLGQFVTRTVTNEIYSA